MPEAYKIGMIWQGVRYTHDYGRGLSLKIDPRYTMDELMHEKSWSLPAYPPALELISCGDTEFNWS